MATLTISMGPHSASYTVSAADVTRILDAYRADYGAGLTEAQLFDAFADGIAAGMANQGTAHEQRTSMEAAKAAVVAVQATKA